MQPKLFSFQFFAFEKMNLFFTFILDGLLIRPLIFDDPIEVPCDSRQISLLIIGCLAASIIFIEGEPLPLPITIHKGRRSHRERTSSWARCRNTDI